MIKVPRGIFGSKVIWENYLSKPFRDGDGVPVSYPAEAPVALPQKLAFPIKIGPPKSGLTIRITQGETVLAEKILSETTLGRFHRSTTDLIGLVGQNEVGITQAVEWLNRERADDIEAFAISSALALPENAGL